MIPSQTPMIIRISILLVLASIAGCAGPIQVPFCLPDRPELIPVSVEHQRELHAANPEALASLAQNSERLKTFVSTVEEMAQEYNDTLELGSCESLTP